MSTSLRSVVAAFAVALVSASCSGGGSSSSTAVPGLQPSSTQTTQAARSVAGENHGDHDGGHPTPSPTPLPTAGPGAYSLFGDATLVHPGHNSPTAVQATSTGPNAYGGVSFTVNPGMTVSQLLNLSTDYKFTVGSCGLGSPRFSVAVTNGTASGHIFVYIGPPPNYTGCPPNVWTNTGNLTTPASLVDDSQLPGGTFYDPYAAAQTKYGTYTITGIALVVDGPNQTVQFDNTMINATTYTYESAASCENGGYKLFTGSPGPFKNEAACDKFFNGNKGGDDDGHGDRDHHGHDN